MSHKLVAFALAAVLLGACGGGDDAPDAADKAGASTTAGGDAPLDPNAVTGPEDLPADFDACPLLTVEEVRAAANAPVAPGYEATGDPTPESTSGGSLSMRTCEWSYIQGTANYPASIKVSVSPDSAPVLCFGPNDTQAVQGVGDRAALNPDGTGAVALIGSVCARVGLGSAYHGQDGKARAAAASETLLRTVVTRLADKGIK